MSDKKNISQKIVKGACDFVASLTPKSVYDYVEENPTLRNLNNIVNSLKTNKTVSNYVNRFAKNNYTFDGVFEEIVNKYDASKKSFKEDPFELGGATQMYVTLVKIFLSEINRFAKKEGYKFGINVTDELIYNIAATSLAKKESAPSIKLFLYGMGIGNPFLIYRGLLGKYGYKEGGILRDFLTMFDSTSYKSSNLFGKHLSRFAYKEPSIFNKVKEAFITNPEEKAFFHHIFTSTKSFMGAIYRFMAYTINYQAGIILGVVQSIAYENLKMPFRGEDMKKVHDIRNQYGILPENSLLNINKLIGDAHSNDSFGYLLYNALDNLTAFLDKYPKLKEYVMQTSGGLHQIVDLIYDNSIRNIAFLRALRSMGIAGVEDLGKKLERLTEKEKERFLEILKQETISYYEDMRGFPINYGLNKIQGKFWAPFFYVFGFMSSWGLNVMKTALNDITLPLREALVYYGETGDFKVASEIFMSGLTSERFLYALMTIAHSGLMGHRIDEAIRDDTEEENSKIAFIKKIIRMSTYFNQSLQAFQSNVVGRLYMEGINGLFYDTGANGDVTTFILYKSLQELTRDFMKEFKVVDPFMSGINTYNEALKAGASQEEAQILAYNAIFEGFKKGFGGYVRYLQPTQVSMDDYYWQHVSGSDVLSFVLGENVNKDKEHYYNLKDYESYLHLFKDKNRSANAVNYIIWNMPILRGFAKDDYSIYMGNFGQLVNELVNDDNLWKLRTTGVVPLTLSAATDTQQEEWINMLYNDLTKWAPQKTDSQKSVFKDSAFLSDEMKRIFRTAYKSLPETEENIWVKKMMETLLAKGTYEAYLKLYKSHNGEADENSFRGMVQILGMLDAQSPGASRKFLSMFAYSLMNTFARSIGKTYTRLTPKEALYFKRKILKVLLPLMAFKPGKGYIDYSFQTNAIQSYLKIMKPKLFASIAAGGGDKTKSKYLNKGVLQYIALDMYTMNSLLSGDVNAYKIKNLYTKVGNSLQDDNLKIAMINKTLETIDKLRVDIDDKRAIETGILLGNIKLLDKLLLDNEFKAKHGKLADALIQRLRANNKYILNEKDNLEKALNVSAISDKAGHKGFNPYYNNKFKNNYPLHNKLTNYAQKNYGRLQRSGAGGNSSFGTRYSPVYGTSAYRKPYIMKFYPYYVRGYRAAISKDLIKKPKQLKDIKRHTTVKEGKIKPIKPSKE